MAPIRLAGALALASCWGLTVGAAPLDPSPAACGACHPAAFASWSTSRHAVAATNAVFTASWEHWPNGWCLGCHAPAPDQQIARLGRPAVAGVIHALPSAEPGARWADGVDCAACHLRDGVVLSARPVTELAASMHPTRHAPELSDERACAGCHSFPFQLHTPPWPFAYGDTPAQDTIEEWRGSAAAARGEGCQDCHMGARGHGFPGAHDPALVRGAVHVEAWREPDGLVRARISAPDAPHRIPTGDPFRRLLLEACADADCAEVLAKVTVRRLFTPTDTSWRLVEDRSLPPTRPDAPSHLDLTLGPAPLASTWRLSYRFGDARFEPDLPPEAVGYLIATGSISDRPPQEPR